MSVANELSKLKELLDEGVLTHEEFNAQKARLLAQEDGAAPDAGETAQTGDANQPSMVSTTSDIEANPTDTPEQSLKRTHDDGLSGAAIAAIAGGALMVLTLAIVLVFVFKESRGDTSEAVDNLDKIYKGAAVYYSTPYVLPTGQKVPCQFPANQGVTPVEGTCCSTGGLGGPDNNQDDRCDKSPAIWDEATWAALNFYMSDEHYFVYAFDSEGTLKEANFRATANADMDCDSIQSTFQRIAFGDENANFAECSLHGAPAMFIDRERE